jgi:hypothetical protein
MAKNKQRRRTGIASDFAIENVRAKFASMETSQSQV